MSKRLLLVDDEVAFVDITKARLERNGFDVITAHDGEDALEKAKNENPDIILLDLMLPKLDGFMVCKILKFDEHYQHIPIILLTALSMDCDRQLGYESGADKYLTKPFEPNVLIDAINSLIQVGSGPAVKDVLEVIELFKPLSEDELKIVQEKGSIHKYPSDTVLMQQSEQGDALYVIISGQVRVDQSDFTSSTQQIGTLGANQVIGEVSVLTGEPRSATITTIHPTTCLRISKDVFEELLNRRPLLGLDLINTIVERKNSSVPLLEKDPQTLHQKLSQNFQL